MSSRILTGLAAFAAAFAQPEVAAAAPYVQKAIGELPADLKTSDPVGAAVTTMKNAYDAMKADPSVTPSFTGLLGAVANAALVGWEVYQTAPADAAPVAVPPAAK